MENEEVRLLRQQIEIDKKRLLYSRITCVAAAVAAVALVFFLVIVGPDIRKAADGVAEVSAQLDGLELSELELQETLDSITRFADTSEETVGKLTEQLDSMDLASLNKAVKTLSDAVDTLGRFFS